MIKILSEQNILSFVEYCKKHRYDHDESFLYDEDLDDFIISDENPTFLLFEGDKLTGVASFIMDEYQRSGKKARVRIFHCESGSEDDYRALLEISIPILRKINTVVIFLPEKATVSRRIFVDLGFQFYRTSYVLTKEDRKFQTPIFPKGYELTDFVENQDENDYLTVRNLAFQSVKGSETPITLEMVKEQTRSSSIISKGVKILRFQRKAVGIIRIERETENEKDYSFIAPIGIVPEHQGQGLGKELLHAGILAGVDVGLLDSMLCVNADNERALKLYLNEGFKKQDVMECYHLLL